MKKFEKNNFLKINADEIKQIELNMLIEFAKFCEANSLKYNLAYGTLLGCVRHKGFIPWDDDIDICMPRDDYDTLYMLLKEKDFSIGDKYKLAAYDNKYSVNKLYYNIIDPSTITISSVRRDIFYYPVFIDIFPIDKEPKELIIREKLSKKIAHYMNYAQMPIWKRKGIFKEPIKYFLRVFMKCNFNKADRLYKECKDLKEFDSFLMSIDYSFKYKYNFDYFDDYIMGEFEGNLFRIPKDYDTCLKVLYGNYMELPPEEERKPHFTEAYYLQK